MEDGTTPACAAQYFHHTEIVQLLISNGATPPPPPFFRGDIDQIGLHTTKKCLNNHGLIRFNVPNSKYFCDICVKQQQTTSVMYGCDECDYDICVSCL